VVATKSPVVAQRKLKDYEQQITWRLWKVLREIKNEDASNPAGVPNPTLNNTKGLWR
jgi:hypothetical protein